MFKEGRLGAIILAIVLLLYSFADAHRIPHGNETPMSRQNKSGTPVHGCDHATSIDATTDLVVIPGTANRHTVLCLVNIVTAGAENLALIAGTGTVCGTDEVGLAGGATAATGWNLDAKSGLIGGNGETWINWNHTKGDDVCLLKSGSGQASGWILWTYADTDAVLYGNVAVPTTTTTTSTTTTTTL